MVSKLANILIAFLIILTVVNIIFLVAVYQNVDLRNFYFLGQSLPDAFLDIEKVHMQEVKNLSIYSLLINIIGILFLTWSVFKKYIDLKYLAKILLLASIAMALAALFFSQIFLKFHQIFFVGQNWFLPVDSVLIRTYPLDYFKTQFLIWDLVVFILGLLFMAISHKIDKK